MPLRGQDVTLWVKVPEYEATYGVAFSPSVHSVRQELERDYARCGAGEPPNSISGTSSEAYGCEECQCT